MEGLALALTASCLTQYFLFLTTGSPPLTPRQMLDWSLWELRFIEHLLYTRHCAHVIITANIYRALPVFQMPST